MSTGMLGTMFSGGPDVNRWAQVLNELRDPDPKVRIAAAESLPDLAFAGRSTRRTPEQVQTRSEQLKELAEIIRDKEEDPRVRAPLIHALAVGEFGAAAQPVVPALIHVLGDESDHDRVRGEAAMVLPYIGPPDRVGPTILTATQSRSNVVRVNAFQALSQVAIAPDDLLRLLVRSIEDPDATIRRGTAAYAARLVQERKDQRALVILLRAARDRDGGVRRSAVMLLRSLRPDLQGLENELVAFLKSPEPMIRANAAAALLSRAGDTERYAAVLTEMLQSKEAPLRESAAQALVASGPEAQRLVPALTRLIRDRETAVRIYAATALANITGKATDSAPILIEALTVPDERVVWLAAGALDLVMMQDPGGFEPLMSEAARHNDPFVRAIAIRSLGRLARDRVTAISLFTGALHDPDVRVRVAALESLGGLGPEARPVLSEVRKSLKDPSGEIRKVARQTMEKISGISDENSH